MADPRRVGERLHLDAHRPPRRPGLPGQRAPRSGRLPGAQLNDLIPRFRHVYESAVHWARYEQAGVLQRQRTNGEAVSKPKKALQDPSPQVPDPPRARQDGGKLRVGVK